jgi:adenylate kinase family enzyme
MKNTSILRQQVNKRTTLVADESTTYLQDERTTLVASSIEARAEVIFVLGPPGSGKTTMVSKLKDLLERQGRNVVCFDDYPLLFARAAREQSSGQNPTHTTQFCRIVNEDGKMKGFTVEDGVVLEQVLCEINGCICQYLHQANTVILVEFARDHYLYERVWQYFCHEVRMTARYLFCDADFDVCVKRVQCRTQRIDLEVMYTYYHQDGLPSLMKNCNLDRIEIISTDGTLQETNAQVACFLEKLSRAELFKAEMVHARETLPSLNGFAPFIL